MRYLIYIFVIAVAAASCNTPDNSANMKADANKAKLQRFYDEVINAHNTALIDSFCTPEFVDHHPDPSHTGKGINDLKANFTELFAAFPDIRVTANFIIAQGDTAMAYVTMTGTNTGAMGNAPPSNKQINIEGMDVIVLKDGKATDRWGIFDDMKMMTQLGMLPAPGAMPDSAMTNMDDQKK